ncbi:MAG TPA: DUF2336 domain-containing protein [Stellaceae bacterium]|nr:DUF2336 domain-containing protein [Stellaceae bacterium]
MAALTRWTVDKMIEETSWTQRAKLLERIATRFVEGTLDALEWSIATDVFRVALYDGEPLVRRVLAEAVKDAVDLPRDILLGLISDVAEVAIPVLGASPLLSDDDLLVIACASSIQHRLAMASRASISERVSDALCRCGEPIVVAQLLANEGAAIGSSTLAHLFEAAV